MNLRGLNRLGVSIESSWSRPLALAICVLLFAASPVWSQTNVARPRYVSNRYLLIVETSHSMHRRFDGVVKTVGNLLASGIGGQIQQGDTLGLWTYNEQLYSGRLRLQHWSKYEREDICSGIMDFVKSQKYEKQPVFASVRPALDKVIKDSEFITIIIISSGEDTITGTPFDDKINELYKNWRAEQEKARMPIVTVLRAKRGTITGFSVTPPPWQIEMPAWPPEPAVAKALTPQRPAVSETPAPKVQPSTVPPLIVTGKIPDPETTHSAEAATTATQSALPNPTNQQFKPANPPVESAAVQSPTVVPQTPAANLPPERTTVVEAKTEKPEVPQRPPDPTPAPRKETASSNSTAGPEKAPVVSDRTNPPVPAQALRKPTPPPQEVLAGVATPGSGLLSSKAIWLGGAAVLFVTCAILVVLARRPRSEPVSLITRSLGRERND